MLAAWSGIRPLVFDPNKPDTQSVARNHIIEVSTNNLVTIAGGECRCVCVWGGGGVVCVGEGEWVCGGGCACVCVCVCMCTCMLACVYACINMCVFVYVQ